MRQREGQLDTLFRGEITPLSSSYKIPGLVPEYVCSCEPNGLKPAEIQKFDIFAPVRAFFLKHAMHM